MIDSHGASGAKKQSHWNRWAEAEACIKLYGKILHGDITADLALLPTYSWFQKHEREHDPQCVVQIKLLWTLESKLLFHNLQQQISEIQP